MSPHFRTSCEALLRLEDPGVPHGKGGVADQVPWLGRRVHGVSIAATSSKPIRKRDEGWKNPLQYMGADIRLS